MTTRYTQPSEQLTLNHLKRYLKAFATGNESWRYYRWFFATRTIENMPVGKSGAFIVLAGRIKECHRGWFLVASSASKHQLVGWEHWDKCVAITHNKLSLTPLTTTIERKLGRDPQKWVATQSSKNPEDWIIPHASAADGRSKRGRPKKVLTTEE